VLRSTRSSPPGEAARLPRARSRPAVEAVVRAVPLPGAGRDDHLLVGVGQVPRGEVPVRRRGCRMGRAVGCRVRSPAGIWELTHYVLDVLIKDK
jgi:hypothetical protein